MFAGLVAAALVAILGNLAGVRSWIRAEDPPRDYAWFDPSRVIPDTINEFPAFSFLLGDLHAHVLALPFTVLALAFAHAGRALSGPRSDLLWRAVAEALAAGLAIGMLYAINSWSYPVAAGVLAAAVVTWHPRRRAARLPARLAGAGADRQLRADRPVRVELRPGGARDRLRARAAPVRQVAGRHALIYGILIWPLLAAIVIRLREAQHTLALDRLGRSPPASCSARCWPPTT